MDAVVNDAVELRREFRQQSVQPELILLALIRRPDTAAARIFREFSDQRGLNLERLERQVERAAQSRRDQNGNLDFTARGNKKVPLSKQSIIMLDEALSEANSQHETRIDTDHALQVLAESSMSTSGLLRQENITPKAIKDLYTDNSRVQSIKQHGTVMDHVKASERGNLRAVHYREELLREMINVLSQSVSRHIILVGPEGVGKRTLAYSLAHLMAQGKGPVGLSSLVQIDEAALLESEQEAVRAGLSKSRNGILFIPHIHRFFGTPLKAEFSKTTSLVQKSFLDDDPIIIATTTDQDYQERLTNISALTENSQIIRVEEPSPEETTEMLKILRPHLEDEYEIEIDEEALKATVNFARRYLTTMPLPRSAEHLLHRTAAMVANSRHDHLMFKPEMSADGLLDVEDVTIAASEMTGIPVSKLGEDERMRYAKMIEHLKEHIIGQDEAVMAVSRAIKTARVGLKDPNKPIGSFLFLGPTGVGKTELARVLAEFMFGSQSAMLPLDMSEFKESSSINRLTGSAPGYVGSEEGGQLTERVRQQPYIVVLFDEIEKAHPEVMDLLLQVFEEGRMTSGTGTPVRFTDAVIIMTSNMGSEYLSVPMLTDEIKTTVMEDVVKQELRPEFINRIDEVVMFNALSDESLAGIMELLLDKEKELAEERGLHLSFTEGAVDYLLSLNDEPEYGARPLKRIIRRHVRQPLADFLLQSNPPAGTEVRISASRKKGKGLKFSADVDGEEYTKDV
jgi:ATP-dependent Clp protease ATP-binding subunit ClpC